MTPKQRDIVLVPVPFTDLTATKRRPVLVLSNDAYNRRAEDVVVAAVTSQLTREEYAVRISQGDLQEGLLPRESLVRADKTYALSKTILIKRFGALKRETFLEVLAQIDRLWGR